MAQDNSKPIYRKSKYVDRQFFKVEGDLVTKVLLKEKSALIETSELWTSRCSATDDWTTLPSTEEEFMKAHSDAITTCTLMKIL